MADNTQINVGIGGDVIASDEIAGIKHQRVKMQYGDDGIATDVSTNNPMPVTGKYFSNQVGTWGYASGVSGTIVLTGGKKVIGISAFSTSGGTMVINGGSSYPIVSATGIFISPQGNISDPTIVFVGTNSYFIEYVI